MGSDNLFMSEPGAFPFSSLPGKSHLQEQEPGDGKEESGKHDLIEHGRCGRCHHRQRRTRAITPDLWRDSLTVHRKTPGNQSFIPPSRGTALTHPADLNIPAARLAWASPSAETTQIGRFVGCSLRNIRGAASSEKGSDRARRMCIAANSFFDRTSIS